jgi:hypothetical protein
VGLRYCQPRPHAGEQYRIRTRGHCHRCAHADIPFTVYVHDFTNTAQESDSRALADSGATVSIKFAGVEQPLVFNVPSQEGTLWKVCTIYGGKVTGVNEMTYEGRPLNIGADD